MLEVTFRAKYSKICNEEKEMVRRLGPRPARLLQLRLTQLKAVNALSDMYHFSDARLHELKQGDKGVFSLDLVHPYRLLVRPEPEPPPFLDDGGIDVDSVTGVKVVDIRDTHDGKKRKR